MRILLLLLISLFTQTLSYGQTVNGVPLKDIEVEYVEIVGTSVFMSNKVTINIDFGQRTKLFSNGQTKLLGDDGNPIKLNSMIDALNFMSENGYMFVSSYVLTVSNQNVYHYLLKKK